jgi:hypothetical protein
MKPGRVNSSVVIAPAGDDEGTVVDSGRKIDPRSLRRDGTGVSWLEGGVRRSAPLP